MLVPSVKRVQQRIVTLHDYFRNKVSPPAANMLSMVSSLLSLKCLIFLDDGKIICVQVRTVPNYNNGGTLTKYLSQNL